MPKERKRLKKNAQVARKTKPKKLRFGGRFKGWSGKAGGAIGAYLGGPLGSTIGTRAGDWFGKISGLGDYKINKNTLLTGQLPVFNSADNSVTLSHREFIGDVVSSGTAGSFDIKSYVINPSNHATFPWLSGVAQQFESYEFTGLVFDCKSTSGVAVGSTNTALGVVVMATLYDVEAPEFTNKEEMEQYEFSVSSKTAESLMHPVECDPSRNVLKMLYTRDASGSDSKDRRFHDHGNFSIATVGLQGTSVTVGELWVTYRVKLYKPRHRTGALGRSIMKSRSVQSGTAFNTQLAGFDPLVNSLRVSFSSTLLTITGAGRYLIRAQAATGVGVNALMTTNWAYYLNTVDGDASFAAGANGNTFSVEPFSARDAVAMRYILVTENEGSMTLPTFTTSDGQPFDLSISVTKVSRHTAWSDIPIGPLPLSALRTELGLVRKSAETYRRQLESARRSIAQLRCVAEEDEACIAEFRELKAPTPPNTPC